MEQQLEFSFTESKDVQQGTTGVPESRQAMDTRDADSPCPVHDESPPATG